MPGQDGVSGDPGEGGVAGFDGRLGLTSGLARTGAFCLRSDQRLRGWNVRAELKRRGPFSKDTYELSAGVSESQVKDTVRDRTRENGQMGARAYYKTIAKPKAAINFSAILQQCPEVAASLSLSDSTAQQLNQKLDAFFVYGKRRQTLDSDIQHLKEENDILSEKLKKVRGNCARYRQ